MSLVEESRMKINRNRYKEKKFVVKNVVTEGKKHDMVKNAKGLWKGFQDMQGKMRTQFPGLDMDRDDFLFKEKKKK